MAAACSLTNGSPVLFEVKASAKCAQFPAVDGTQRKFFPLDGE